MQFYLLINFNNMKKTILVLAIGIFQAASAIAQTTEAEERLRKAKEDLPEGWQTGGLLSLSFSQLSLTNWAAGGQNSVSGNGLVSLFADFRKESLIWNNTLDIGYGLMKQGSDDLIKTDDKIDLLSKFGLKASEHWFYAGLLNFKTQMAPGYAKPGDEEAISNLLAPAYLLGALGMDYKPSGDFSLFLAPLTAKITIVNDDVLAATGAFGVDPGKNSRSEFGGYIRAAYKTDIAENITFQTKADFFSNYLDKPQNIDINWETLLLMKVTEYITVSFATHLIYDDDVMIGIDSNDDGTIDKSGPRTQFKQLLGIGLSYTF
ncbi:MAG TPA: DUF3078 domain-containing protein [Bacteroidales bacterium]|nr:DUF3078 domain-containing protein [Bacteroidales bacterium]